MYTGPPRILQVAMACRDLTFSLSVPSTTKAIPFSTRICPIRRNISKIARVEDAFADVRENSLFFVYIEVKAKIAKKSMNTKHRTQTTKIEGEYDR